MLLASRGGVSRLLWGEWRPERAGRQPTDSSLCVMDLTSPDWWRPAQTVSLGNDRKKATLNCWYLRLVKKCYPGEVQQFLFWCLAALAAVSLALINPPFLSYPVDSLFFFPHLGSLVVVWVSHMLGASRLAVESMEQIDPQNLDFPWVLPNAQASPEVCESPFQLAQCSYPAVFFKAMQNLPREPAPATLRTISERRASEFSSRTCFPSAPHRRVQSEAAQNTALCCTFEFKNKSLSAFAERIGGMVAAEWKNMNVLSIFVSCCSSLEKS